LATSLFLAQSILQSQTEILACLEEIDPNLQAIDRLRGDSKKSNLENIMSWGSAAVYCWPDIEMTIQRRPIDNQSFYLAAITT